MLLKCYNNFCYNIVITWADSHYNVVVFNMSIMCHYNVVVITGRTYASNQMLVIMSL
jgi:hypothetical protein